MPALSFAPTLGALSLALACVPVARTTAQIIVQPVCLTTNHMGTVDRAEATHVLNRMTFGPDSATLAQVQTGNGFVSFVQQQLNPFNLPENPHLDAILQQLGLDTVGAPWTTGPLRKLRDIQFGRIAHAMLGKRQLNEVMTEFWEHHFNTDFWQLSLWIKQNVADPSAPFTGISDAEVEHVQCWMEWTQHEMFRLHALGTFRTLLRELITSPAMMVYLNTVGSSCSTTPPLQTPNENFARELLELFSMGQFYAPNGRPNYTQADIVAVAKLLSGWQLVPNGPFPLLTAQDSGPHCTDAQTLFGNQITIASGTAAAQADALAQALANYEPVKDFICRQLMRWFVADAASAVGVEDAAIAAMKSAWGTDGRIDSVLCALFDTVAFQGPTYRWLRVRSPLERITWHARIWDSLPIDWTTGAASYVTLSKPWEDVGDMGMPLFTYPTPDGFPRDSVERLGSSTTLEGVIAGADIYRGLKPAVDLGATNLIWVFSQKAQLIQILQNELPAPADQANPTLVSQVILERLYPGAWAATDQNEVIAALGTALNPAIPTAYAVDVTRAVSIALSFNNATLK